MSLIAAAQAADAESSRFPERRDGGTECLVVRSAEDSAGGHGHGSGAATDADAGGNHGSAAAADHSSAATDAATAAAADTSANADATFLSDGQKAFRRFRLVDSAVNGGDRPMHKQQQQQQHVSLPTAASSASSRPVRRHLFRPNRLTERPLRSAMKQPSKPARTSKDGSGPALSVSFHRTVKNRRVPHLNDIDPVEKAATWISAEEYGDIKKRCIATVRQTAKRKRRRNASSSATSAILSLVPTADPTVYFDVITQDYHCTRGLEGKTRQGLKERRRLKLDAIAAVLEEQSLQWNDCNECPDEDRGDTVLSLCCSDAFHRYDHEAIMEVYSVFSVPSQQIAHQTGLDDAAAVLEYLRQDYDRQSQCRTSVFPAPRSPSNNSTETASTVSTTASHSSANTRDTPEPDRVVLSVVPVPASAQHRSCQHRQQQQQQQQQPPIQPFPAPPPLAYTKPNRPQQCRHNRPRYMPPPLPPIASPSRTVSLASVRIQQTLSALFSSKQQRANLLAEIEAAYFEEAAMERRRQRQFATSAVCDRTTPVHRQTVQNFIRSLRQYFRRIPSPVQLLRKVQTADVGFSNGTRSYSNGSGNSNGKILTATSIGYDSMHSCASNSSTSIKSEHTAGSGYGSSPLTNVATCSNSSDNNNNNNNNNNNSDSQHTPGTQSESEDNMDDSQTLRHLLDNTIDACQPTGIILDDDNDGSSSSSCDLFTSQLKDIFHVRKRRQALLDDILARGYWKAGDDLDSGAHGARSKGSVDRDNPLADSPLPSNVNIDAASNGVFAGKSLPPNVVSVELAKRLQGILTIKHKRQALIDELDGSSHYRTDKH